MHCIFISLSLTVDLVVMFHFAGNRDGTGLRDTLYFLKYDDHSRILSINLTRSDGPTTLPVEINSNLNLATHISFNRSF